MSDPVITSRMTAMLTLTWPQYAWANEIPTPDLQCARDHVGAEIAEAIVAILELRKCAAAPEQQEKS